MPRPASPCTQPPAGTRHRVLPRLLGGLVAALTTVALAAGLAPALAPAAYADNPVTPGNFTGFGFDQCTAPEAWKMDAWMQSSPFQAVGIYIAGASRGCRNQPNLTTDWVATELASGWRLLPIDLGPQASCNPMFPRYGNDPVISPKLNRKGAYKKAAKQGTAEANVAVQAAQALGIVARSTLWYDLEGFDVTNAACRESSLWFLSAWTAQVHALGYVSGVYSSAGSGIAMLDDARVLRPGVFTLPDRIWVARWDGLANTSTSYIRPDGWMPGNRVKQYQGGHNEKWGGVKINIDRSYLDLGSGSIAAPESHCHGTTVDLPNYRKLLPAGGSYVPDPASVTALKCLLKEQGVYQGKLAATWTPRLTTAVHAWQARVGMGQVDRWSRRAWMTLLAAGDTPTIKYGSYGEAVYRLQRALDASSRNAAVLVTGTFDPTTDAALRAWQTKNGLDVSGVAGVQSWAALQAGNR